MSETSFGAFLKSAPSYIKLRIYLLVAIALISVIVSVSLTVWIWKQHRGIKDVPHAAHGAHEEHLPKTVDAFTYSYEIKDMSMAVMNKKGLRTAYAQFSLMLDCPTEASKRLMELNRAKVLNMIFEAGGDFYIEDFEAPKAAKGFESFKGSILKKLQAEFKSLSPRNVVLKDWVMN